MRLIASEWFYTFDLGSAWCWNNQVVAGGWNSHSWWHWHRPLTCGWCWHGWGCSDTTSRKRRTWRQTWGRRFWNTHTCKKNIETWNTHDASVIILEKKTNNIFLYIFIYFLYFPPKEISQNMTHLEAWCCPARSLESMRRTCKLKDRERIRRRFARRQAKRKHKKVHIRLGNKGNQV